jgi:hypothetical protein
VHLRQKQSLAFSDMIGRTRGFFNIEYLEDLGGHIREENPNPVTANSPLQVVDQQLD